jgi:colicin import membrane protein
MSADTPSHTSRETAPESDPFRYGYRWVEVKRPDGTTDREEVPLTLEDLLHPQFGDVIVENIVHNFERDYLADVFRARLAGVHGALVLSDCSIEWGVEGIRNMAPDIALVFNVNDPGRSRDSFNVPEEKTAPSFVLEIVSPKSRENDVEKKFRLYHAVGVPEYLIVDQERRDGPRRLIHYRRGPERFEEVPVSPDNCVLIEPVRLRLCLRENRIACFDADTGDEMGDYTQEYHLRADAEQRARDEAKAREEAERKAREEERGREEAERKAREEEQRRVEEARAREAAERQAHQEAEARQALEERLRELEVQLQQLRGGGEPEA